MYISDLDGTLLKRDKTISKYSIQVINNYIESGGLFTIATARSITTAKKIIKEINFNIPVILLNGVFIYDIKEGRYIVKHLLANFQVIELIKICNNFKIEPWIFVQDKNGIEKIFYRRLDNCGKREFYKEKLKNNDKRFRKVDEFPDLIGQDANHFTIIDTYENLKEAADFIKDLGYGVHFYEDVYLNGFYLLEITNKIATKRNAVEWIKREYNSEQLVCFGDNINDISMFEVADYSVCVSNGRQELKKIASVVVGSNDEDAVAKFINSSKGKIF